MHIVTARSLMQGFNDITHLTNDVCKGKSQSADEANIQMTAFTVIFA